MGQNNPVAEFVQLIPNYSFVIRTLFGSEQPFHQYSQGLYSCVLLARSISWSPVSRESQVRAHRLLSTSHTLISPHRAPLLSAHCLSPEHTCVCQHMSSRCTSARLLMLFIFAELLEMRPWRGWELTLTKLGMSPSQLQRLGCCQFWLHQRQWLNGSVSDTCHKVLNVCSFHGDGWVSQPGKRWHFVWWGGVGDLLWLLLAASTSCQCHFSQNISQHRQINLVI